jgi:hypothetical protein
LRRLAVLLLVALAAAVAAPAPAASAWALDPTLIVPGRAIGKATLFASRATIDGRLGRGLLVKSVRTDFGRLVTYRYVGRGVDVTYRAGRAVAIRTEDRRYETRGGIRVGSTRAALKRTYGSLHCPTATICTVGELLPGARVTDFRLTRRTHRVVSVLVGVVLD